MRSAVSGAETPFSYIESWAQLAGLSEGAANQSYAGGEDIGVYKERINFRGPPEEIGGEGIPPLLIHSLRKEFRVPRLQRKRRLVAERRDSNQSNEALASHSVGGRKVNASGVLGESINGDFDHPSGGMGMEEGDREPTYHFDFSAQSQVTTSSTPEVHGAWGDAMETVDSKGGSASAPLGFTLRNPSSPLLHSQAFSAYPTLPTVLKSYLAQPKDVTLSMQGRWSGEIESRTLLEREGIGLVVSDFTLSCPLGGVFCLLGPNGGGKTTLLNLILGIETPSEGRIWVGGHPPNSFQARAQVGYCPQKDTLWPSLTPFQHLTYFSQVKGKSREEGFRIAQSLLASAALSHKANTPTHCLSGGQRRRLSLCIALVGAYSQRLCILDELTAGLDADSRARTWALLLAAKAANKNILFMMVSHDMEEVEVMSESEGRCGVMSHGRMRALGTLPYIKQRYGGGAKLFFIFLVESFANFLTCVEESFLATIVPGSVILSQCGSVRYGTYERPLYQGSASFSLFLNQEDVSQAFLKVSRMEGIQAWSLELTESLGSVLTKISDYYKY